MLKVLLVVLVVAALLWLARRIVAGQRYRGATGDGGWGAVYRGADTGAAGGWGAGRGDRLDGLLAAAIGLLRDVSGRIDRLRDERSGLATGHDEGPLAGGTAPATRVLDRDRPDGGAVDAWGRHRVEAADTPGWNVSATGSATRR